MISVTIKSRKYVCWVTNWMGAISSCINRSAQFKKDLHLIWIGAPRISEYDQSGAYIQGSTYRVLQFLEFPQTIQLFLHLFCYKLANFTHRFNVSIASFEQFMSNYRKEIIVNHRSCFKSFVSILLNFILKYNSSRISAKIF